MTGSCHTIRLAGPWELHRPSGHERGRLPCLVPPGSALLRRFHRPNGLSETSVVRLKLNVSGGNRICPVVDINGHSVPVDSVERPNGDLSVLVIDATPCLEPFNFVRVTAAGTAELTVVSAEIQIEETAGRSDQ